MMEGESAPSAAIANAMASRWSPAASARPPRSRPRPSQMKTVAELLDIRPQRLKSAHQRADAIAFLYAELGRARDVQLPAVAGPGRQGRDLVDEIRNLVCS